MYKISITYKAQDIKLILIRSLYVKSERGWIEKEGAKVYFSYFLSQKFSEVKQNKEIRTRRLMEG